MAELGRPETPEETAERKAEASRNHRNRQTVNNLILSLLATLALVVVIVLIVPRAQPQAAPSVDYASVAAQGQGTEPDPLIAPVLPSTWHSNAAELRTGTADGIDAWYIGFITPDDQYLGVTQGFDANETWLANQLHGTPASTTRSIGGVTWTVYDNRDRPGDHGNVDYALTATSGTSTYVVFGTAGEKEFITLASAVATTMKEGQ